MPRLQKFKIPFWGSVSLVCAYLFLTACVPAKEHRALVSRYEGLQEKTAELERANDTLSVRNYELRSANSLLQKRLEDMMADSTLRGIRLQRAEEELARLRANYRDLDRLQKALVEGNQKETSQLLSELQQQQRELQQREDAVKELERQLHQRRIDLDKIARQQEADRQALALLQANLDSMSAALEAKNADLTELRRLLARKDSITDALRQRVSDALFGFKGDGLSVHMRNGRVYVSLEEKLMFKTGRYDVDQKGREALRHLIPVLEQNPDINVLVEGHTDDVPMRGSGPIQDNWDLSVKRATSIVRILLDGSAIAPERVSAAGKAEFEPLEKAKTAEARQKNRRTEIILTPKMDELLEAIGLN